MRKKVLAQDVHNLFANEGEWLDLERLAQVEVTSESPAHPVEAALLQGREGGWRASQAGEQRLHLLFDHERARTQELVLLWSPPGNSALREIVRQQYNFSPPITTREVEDYVLNLGGVGVLELRMKPHVGGVRRSRR